MKPAIAIDLDGALGDTRGLWQAFLEDAARRFGSIAPLDPGTLPGDRSLAAAELDRWASAGVGDWRAALARFAQEHAPVHLRPSAPASRCLRELSAAGHRLGVFTDAPLELAEVALAHLGLRRRIDALEAGDGALARLRARLDSAEPILASTLDDLARISAGEPERPR